MGADQRRYQRKAISVQFSARDASGAAQLVFTSADLSAGGTFFVSDLLLEIGETLSLELQVPGRATAIRAQARVAWVRRFPEAGEAAGMGIEFVTMREDDRAALLGFLA